MNNKLPLISVVIPAFNEERNLIRLINSLKRITYPRSRIEYILIDDSSDDSTRTIAKSFGMIIISTKTHDIELNKGIGMHKAKGEFVYWLDADMEICSKDFFQLMVNPLLEDKQIIGSFTKEFALDYKNKPKSSLLRFISYDALQRDPVYQFFSTDVTSTIFKKEKKYFLCRFLPGECPPVGRILYRRRELLSTRVGKNKSYIDLESTEIVVREGFSLFAYVPQAKIRHYHAETIKQLVVKRLRNLNRDYLPNIEKKYFTWFNLRNNKDILKIIFWIIWVNLFIPEFLIGFFKMIKYMDIAFLWQPVVSIVTTDCILFGFLKQPKGRQLVLKMFNKLLKI